MDLVIPIVIFILVFVACSVCGYCCKRNKQGIVYGIAEQPTGITTTYQTGAMPYPTNNPPMHHAPSVVPPAAGFAPHAAYPPTTPYPPAPTSAAPPYPPASAGFPGTAPYPTMPMPGAYTSPVPAYPAVASPSANQLPPSYAEAIQTRNASVNASVNAEGYSQQSSYNPNYN